MTDITIPLEALEAAAKAIADLSCPSDLFVQCVAAGGCVCREQARSACLAMLKAWPGMTWACRGKGTPPHLLFLPMPAENTND